MIDKIIQDLIHQGWSFQRGVLSVSELRTLRHLFTGAFVPARVGKQEGRQRVEEIRGDMISWVDPLDPPKEFQKQLQWLEELRKEINQNLYLGLKEFECHLATYPVGAFYKKHLDRFEKDSSRSLSFIYYLHEEWGSEDGGELVIYNQKNDVLETIVPEPGSFVCFLSAEFPHEVRPAKKERRSLTGWMHTKLIY